MGQVLIAHDEVLGREVALKVLRPDRAIGPTAAGRLEREARITAALDHPSIVAVHDLGQTPDGLPFYVMRLVRGRALDQELAQRTDMRGRLQLVRPLLAAVEAIAYAHHRGVVHRDLKPANVMLGPFGEVQVMDWGLAAPLGERSPGLIGTPGYTAPEVGRGEAAADRSDVWSLGAVLRDILTTPAGARPPPELAAIAQACLATEPTARPSARALADELGRWLDGHRVQAYDYPLSALVGRVVRRWRWPLAVAAVALVVLAVVLVRGHAELVAERDRASERAARLLADEAARHFVADRLADAERVAAELLAMALPDASRRDRAVARGVSAARHARPTRVGVAPMPAGCVRPTVDASGHWLACLDGERARLFAIGADRLEERWSIGAAATQVAIGDEVVLADARGVATRHALASGQGIGGALAGWEPARMIAGRDRAVAFNRTVALVADGGAVTRVEHACAAGTNALARTPDGASWVFACADGTVRAGPFGAAPTHEAGLPIKRGEDEAGSLAATTIAWDGHLLAWGDARGRVGLATFDGRGRALARWQRVLSGAVAELALRAPLVIARLADGSVHALSIDGDALTTFAAGADGFVLGDDGLVVFGAALERWSVPEVRPHRLVIAPGVGLTGVSPDGARLAIAVGDGRVVVTDLDGRRLALVQPRDTLVKPVAWTTDGRIAGSWMGQAGLELVALDGRAEHLAGHAFRRVVALAGGHLLAVGFGEGSALYAGVSPLPPRPELAMPVFVDAGASPDGRFAVLVPELDRSLTVLDARTSPPSFAVVATTASAHAGDIDDDGRRVVLARERDVVALDLASHEERPLDPLGSEVLDVALDGALAAGGCDDGRVALWSTTTGELLAVAPGHSERVVHVEFCDSGRTLVSASWDGTVRLWDVAAMARTPGRPLD